jgi:hypothetical protein
MDQLEFIAILATPAFLIFWYWQNLRADAAGVFGLLALKDDPEAAKPGGKMGAYRVRTRLAPGAGQRRGPSGPGPRPKKTYKLVDDHERMRRRFRRQDEARYRAKDKAAPLRRRQEEDAY